MSRVVRPPTFTGRQMVAGIEFIDWSLLGVASKSGVPLDVVEAFGEGREIDPGALELICRVLWDRGGLRPIPATKYAGEGVRLRWTEAGGLLARELRTMRTLRI
jgi:hypothetical protein